ncbi:alpha-N-acetylgalactosamine-specific lectin-like [Ostrea edulis]|uniref:alpha-N-acetylgalactosamine-specific lectin-like n=1 Tax=Ostrea edulis TaxID=37623 RepID=UPI0024AF7365|nr:alpha-N-acetylgalactosamine-specific lectin-like [Ostrea edulis]
MNIQLLIFLTALTTVFAVCPTNWRAHNDRCFFLSKDNETLAGALKLCQAIGSQYGRTASLATVDDVATQKFLENPVKQSGYNGFYIGLTDIVEEDTFVWISSGKTATYTNWGTIQPNNRYGNENCVVFRNEPGYVMTWTDDPCTDLNNYICEMAVAEIHVRHAL